MTEEQKDKHEEKDGCCGKGSHGSGGCGCCGSRCSGAMKFLLGLLLGLLLAGAGFWLYSAGRCSAWRSHGKMAMSCPVMAAPAASTPAAPAQ